MSPEEKPTIIFRWLDSIASIIPTEEEKYKVKQAIELQYKKSGIKIG